MLIDVAVELEAVAFDIVETVADTGGTVDTVKAVWEPLNSVTVEVKTGDIDTEGEVPSSVVDSVSDVAVLKAVLIVVD